MTLLKHSTVASDECFHSQSGTTQAHEIALQEQPRRRTSWVWRGVDLDQYLALRSLHQLPSVGESHLRCVAARTCTTNDTPESVPTGSCVKSSRKSSLTEPARGSFTAVQLPEPSFQSTRLLGTPCTECACINNASTDSLSTLPGVSDPNTHLHPTVTNDPVPHPRH